MSEGPPPPQTDSETPPTSPTDLPKRDLKESARRAIREFKVDRGGLISAGMAFYWFLALFPAIIAAVGVLGLLDVGADTVKSINDGISKTLPGDAGSVLRMAVTNATHKKGGGSLVATIVGLALALWSASAGMVALEAGMDVAYDVEEERKLVAKRGKALLLILVTLVLGGIATALVVFGKPLGQLIQDHLPFDTGFALVWTVVRWAVALFALVTLFACYYTFGPNRERPRWTWVSPGGVVATAGWLLASVGFSFYVSSLGSSSYGKTYGSFTGVVVLLVWLYLTGLAIVVGAELNAELERQGEHRRKDGRRSQKRRRAERRATTAGSVAAGAPATAPAASPAQGRATAGAPGQVPRRPQASSPAPPSQPAPPSSAPEAGADGRSGGEPSAATYADQWYSYGRRSQDQPNGGPGDT